MIIKTIFLVVLALGENFECDSEEGLCHNQLTSLYLMPTMERCEEVMAILQREVDVPDGEALILRCIDNSK